ncbi:glycoside hydrolase family 3 protein [Paractinoplanes durhamensis]|uniref:Beta-N-acetylhexosaminidase n=1 Tax=Paractinoplanes durhamensis TaxID=113563 RepID=A0ABQ3YNF5_9ACTN|nr:glycoside hydrolase family 3 protein [Actinoplanes durhamensis]GID99075.1 beta-N-acetylhexosaminidase [Actinoplanes durhamensis]
MVIDQELRRLALGTLLAAFPGPAAPPWARSLLADGLAGFTLFGGNVDAPEQLAALTADLRAVRADVVVALDEEGGDVTRLAHRTGSPYPGNAALGAVDDPDLTRAVYAAIGADLVAAGVTLDLAPVVDVNTADDNPIIGTRSFGASTALVARHAAAAVTGLQEAGVSACAKHFPGHGATVTDSHLELPTVDVPLSVLRERDLPPFAATVAAGAHAVMTAHIRVPALTGNDPATFSRGALALLRDLGFEGVIVTDALDMAGAGEITQAAVRSLAAGADLLCLGARVNGELVETIAAEIVLAVRDGRLALSRLARAFSRTAGMASRAVAPGSPRDPDEGLGIGAARRALRVEGNPADLASPLVIQLVTTPSIAAGRVPWGLAPFLPASPPPASPPLASPPLASPPLASPPPASPPPTAEQIEVVAASAGAAELVARAGGRPIVVVGRRVHRLAVERALIEALAAAVPVGVVEMGWPSSWRPAGVRAFVTTYGASRASARVAAEVLGLI